MYCWNRQAVLELLSLEVGLGNHQKESLYFRNFRESSEYEARFTKYDVTYDKSQFPIIKD